MLYPAFYNYPVYSQHWDQNYNQSDCGKDKNGIHTKIDTAFLLHCFCLSHTWLHVDALKHKIHLETRMQVKSYLKPELQGEWIFIQPADSRVNSHSNSREMWTCELREWAFNIDNRRVVFSRRGRNMSGSKDGVPSGRHLDSGPWGLAMGGEW